MQPDRVVALSEQLIEVHRDLRDRLARLRHRAAAAGILQQVRDLLAWPASPATLRREPDGLTAILESHFRFEERRLATLDALGPEAQFPAAFTVFPSGPPR